MTDVAREQRLDAGSQSKMDAWQSHWLRVAKVSLQRDFPRVYDQIFLDLNQLAQSSTILVPLLLKSMEKLMRAKDADSQAALAKLRARGLTPERIAEAEQLVAQLVGAKHCKVGHYCCAHPRLAPVDLRLALCGQAHAPSSEF